MKPSWPLETKRESFTYTSHICQIFGISWIFSFLDEVDVMFFEDIWELCDVFRISVADLGQTGDICPSNSFQDLQIGISGKCKKMSYFLDFCTMTSSGSGYD